MFLYTDKRKQYWKFKESRKYKVNKMNRWKIWSKKNVLLLIYYIIVYIITILYKNAPQKIKTNISQTENKIGHKR